MRLYSPEAVAATGGIPNAGPITPSAPIINTAELPKAGGAPASATAAAEAATAAIPDWRDSLASDELKVYAKNKQFKDPSMAIDAYRNLEKLMGVPREQLLKLPTDEASPDWNDVFSRLGKPGKFEDYKVEGKDADQVKWAKETFHKLNLTSKQAEELTKEWDGRVAALTKTQQETLAAENRNQEQNLKTQWGRAYDQNKAMATKAATALGVTAEVIDAMEKQIGYSKTMSFFHTIGSKMGEHVFARPDSTGPIDMVLTPSEAKAQIDLKMKDKEFTKKYLAGDVRARAEMLRLHEFMAGDADE